jgi:hypothetical protein
LSEVLADRRVKNPLEACRQDLDYPGILRQQHASRPARRVFAYLAQTHGSRRQTELARELEVSPPRIVQLKHRLVDCLAGEDYRPPPTRPLGPPRPKRGRPRVTRKADRQARRYWCGPKGHVRMSQAVQAGGVA